MRLRKFLSLLLSASVAACGTAAKIAPSSEIIVRDDEAIVVMGVKQNYKIAITNGTVKNDVWHLDELATWSANVFPDNGYLVIRLKPRVAPEEYAVASIFPEGNGLLTPSYAPCAGSSVVSFQAAAGTVTYVGDIDYRIDGGRLRFEYSNDAERAQAYLKEKYSRLNIAFKAVNANIRPIARGLCGEANDARIPIVIPIRVPRR
jgi:hypothetical protein